MPMDGYAGGGPSRKVTDHLPKGNNGKKGKRISKLGLPLDHKKKKGKK